MRQITDMETWLLDNGDRLFEYDDISTDSEYLEYYLLSEIRLSYRSIPPSEEDYDE